MSTNCSDSIRTSKMRALRASKKSILFADFKDDRECSENNNLAQRSISLSALSHTTAPPVQTSPLQPRMAQLETLEARMASIEVSLSTTPRRKCGKKSLNGSVSGSAKPPAPSPVPKVASLVDSCKELEMLRHVLRDKENTIQNLQGQIVATPKPLDATERRAVEQKMQQLRLEEDMRRGSIVRVTEALKQINADDNNIDLRIRQAELEYELGREELALLGVREEKRALQARLDAKPSPTLFSCLSPSGKFLLQAATVECDPKSPKFGAGNQDDAAGLRVLWAAEDCSVKKGDRILEVNGKLTLATSKEEFSRLMSVCPSRAELVVCRQWQPPTTHDDLLRRENLRLTHRISYLEDQVADLLSFKEKALTPQVEVFQKGSQVTVLSSPESSRTGSRQVHGDPSDSDQSWMQLGSDTVGPSQQYQDIEATKRTLCEKIRAIQRKHLKEEQRTQNGDTGQPDRDRGNTVSTVYIQSPPVSLSDLERGTVRRKEPRNVDYSSETTCPRYRSHRDRSVKSLDLDVDTSGPDTLTRQPKPQPPKKPLRLSIQRATSLQSMQMGASAPRRGKHKGTAPPPPPVDPPDPEASYNALRWHFHKNRKGRTVHVGEKWC